MLGCHVSEKGYIYIYIVLVSMEHAFGRVLNPLGACRIYSIYIYIYIYIHVYLFTPLEMI